MGWALLAVVAFDLWHVGRPVADQLEPLPKAARDEIMIAALGDEDVRSVYRVADFGWAGARIGPRARVRDIAGQRVALTDPRYVALFSLAQRSSNMLRALNVAVVGFSKKVSGSELTRDLHAIRKQRKLFHVEDPWPLAYWTDRVAVVDKHPEARVWLRMQREPAAVLERPDLPSDFDAAHWGTHLRDGTRPEPRSRGAQLLVQGASRLVLRIDAPRPGMLVVLEGYAPGWEATVDGDPTALVRANVIFRAVPVEAGVHQVVLSYHPRGVVPLWWLWAMTCIALVLAGGVTLRRHLRASSAELPHKLPR
ncbi:MAG: YfhO family protein [Nannocystaceae bacterium]|nr:YfhO family protein [Nannocystaceae bacterium]